MRSSACATDARIPTPGSVRVPSRSKRTTVAGMRPRCRIKADHNAPAPGPRRRLTPPLMARPVRSRMPEFQYQDLLPIGADETPYRLVTTEGVSTVEAAGRTFLQVEPEAMRALAFEAMRDIAHLLRPG